jgi:sentrin-specific protease 1
VINFWMAMLMERDAHLVASDNSPLKRRSLFHNTFFVSKLSENGYTYTNVRRWTLERTLKAKCGVKNIFELDKIVMPVNVGGMHWCLAVIYIQEKKIQYYDSMSGSGMSTLKILKRYLVEEKDNKMKEKLDPAEWTLVPTENGTPQQNNGCDCGVFTCMFADYLGAGEALNFSQADMPHFRYRVGARILEGSAEKLVE